MVLVIIEVFYMTREFEGLGQDARLRDLTAWPRGNSVAASQKYP